MSKLKAPTKTQLSEAEIEAFRQEVYEYFTRMNQSYPWRETTDPYHILVSEFMLQQTQTHRVIPKYLEFLSEYPNVSSLAGARRSNVLELWQGLGYNRRAIYLHQSAQILLTHFSGIIPKDPDTLQTLPGIGPYTAPAIVTFSYNIPTVFIETNIRSVFLHYFFPDEHSIHDSEILPLIEQTLDSQNPRHWYYALMDYGVMIKKKHGNPNTKSKHYTKQSPFEGSIRQKRGEILRILLNDEYSSISKLAKSLSTDDKTITAIISGLQNEGFLVCDGDEIRLTDS